MATTDALKGKNALITATSIVGAVALEFLLERRVDAGKAGKKVSDAVGKLPGNASDLIEDLGRGVKSVTGNTTAAVRGDADEDAKQHSDGDEEFGLDELAERRRQREERRELRRKAI